MIIRSYKLSDQNEVCKLHEDTVRNINDKDYSKEQIETWPGILDNYKVLKQKIKAQKDENELLYKHLLSVKKETNDVQMKFESWNFRILFS